MIFELKYHCSAPSCNLTTVENVCRYGRYWLYKGQIHKTKASGHWPQPQSKAKA